jgi:small redox-active disulfide protein 2
MEIFLRKIPDFFWKNGKHFVILRNIKITKKMTLDIKILGTGCPKCKNLETLTREVVQQNRFDANVSKVEDIMEIMTYKVLSTPALVINNHVVVKGMVPPREEIKKHIEKAING